MKDKLRIEQLKKKFKVKHTGLLNTALFLENLGFEVQISDGIINKESLIVPCVIFELGKRPKSRFLNENKFLKTYLAKIGKKSVSKMNNNEYIDYINESIKNGETLQYKNWRKANQKKFIFIQSLLSRFNKQRKTLLLQVTQFEDGVARLDFGHNDSVFTKRQKMDFLKKKKLYDNMLDIFTSFSLFLKETK
jgi:hypothetical protein